MKRGVAFLSVLVLVAFILPLTAVSHMPPIKTVTSDQRVKGTVSADVQRLLVQKRAFRGSSENQQLAAWRNHLMRIERAEGQTWTLEQRVVVAKGRALLKPGMYSKRAWPAMQAAMVAHVKEIDAAFPDATQRGRLFGVLDDEDLNAAMILPRGRIILVRQEYIPELPDCFCNGERPIMCTSCESGGCSATSWGCGEYWAFACNGWCSALRPWWCPQP